MNQKPRHFLRLPPKSSSDCAPPSSIMRKARKRRCRRIENSRDRLESNVSFCYRERMRTIKVSVSFLLAGALFLLVRSSHGEDGINFEELDAKLLSTITNKNTSDEMMLQCISRLGRNNEPAKFWTLIANDKTYSDAQRKRAVFSLFR